MTPAPDCLIEAGAILCGVDAADGFTTMVDAAIHAVDGNIAEIGSAADLRSRFPDLPRHGGPGMIAMPGMVNGHHHSGITPLMHGVPFAPLEFWLPRFRALRRVPLRLDTLYSAIEMLESGTTTVHHIHGGVSGPPESWQQTADGVLGAYGEIGMRAGFSFMIRDRNRLTYEDDATLLAALPPEVAEWLGAQLAAEAVPVPELMEFYAGLVERWGGSDHVRLNLAPANLHWCSDEALGLIFDTARSAGSQIHMHLLETERQAHFARERTGRSAVAHLHHLGCLGPNVTLGHGNWLSRDDMDLLAEQDCTICHNASSGLRLGSGIAPVNRMLERGLRVALGIDQSGINDDRDMLAEIKLVWALHRETGLWNTRASATQVLRMATEHGAMTAGFGDRIGRLEVGRAADIVLLDRAEVERPAVDPRTPLVDTVLMRAKSQAVEQVFVGGRQVVANGRVIGIDRDAVMAEIAEEMRRPLTDAERQAAAMVDQIVPVAMDQHRRLVADTWRPYRYNSMSD
ncbi:amidohydrolase family protein [Devosia sp. SL43]|uniref:amidohydrolase family protein n=1 Tax=Devosia sp. SL43 TaxID=2806348 RepID=UPI001F441351|nr:amidohydrolase family protein [Devosia sp. SL43]UJW85702.1 amidohydrolase family protein [Devosia sp. SL43]